MHAKIRRPNDVTTKRSKHVARTSYPYRSLVCQLNVLSVKRLATVKEVGGGAPKISKFGQSCGFRPRRDEKIKMNFGVHGRSHHSCSIECEFSFSR